MYKKILTIQDISCIGQCSTTVALPILSACGMETCILPGGLLSTHTYKFKNFTFKDLTQDIIEIIKHWESENIKFDSIYTGYICNNKQIDTTIYVLNNFLKPHGIKFIDPAMADNGSLYTGFDNNFISAMKNLCLNADILFPNITEACLLTNYEYKDNYDKDYILKLIDKLKQTFKNSKIILTGVSYNNSSIGIIICDEKNIDYYEHEKIQKSYHGTGDIYTSSFIAAYLNEKSLIDSAKIAGNYVLKCIKATLDDESHWYGVKFESQINYLINKVNN